MSTSDSALLTIVPFLLGGALFLVGAGRFYARGDSVGVAIFGFAGVLAILLAFVNYSHRIANSK